MPQKFYSDIDINKNLLLNAAIQQLEEPPENPVIGQIYFSTANAENALKIFNGTNWQYVDSGSAVAQQSDWDEQDSTSPAFIKNKPVLPTSTDIGNHTHAMADISDLDDALDSKADAIHHHTINSITGLQDTLDNKSNITHTHTITDVNGLDDVLNSKVSKSLTINNKPLTNNITLSATDVNADTLGSAYVARHTAQQYTDTAINNL